jgi:hypothetical protein
MREFVVGYQRGERYEPFPNLSRNYSSVFAGGSHHTPYAAITGRGHELRLRIYFFSGIFHLAQLQPV